MCHQLYRYVCHILVVEKRDWLCIKCERKYSAGVMMSKLMLYRVWFYSFPHGQNGPYFDRRQFQMHFLEWKWQNSDSNLTENCTEDSNGQQASIGSNNSLASNSRQATNWSNDEPVYWRIYAALGRDKLSVDLSANIALPQFLRNTLESVRQFVTQSRPSVTCMLR